ncbi:MAG: hypothetical protein Q4F49_05370 [Pseudoxanthomonas suwonensis]|nr:hypothetical protein [Pseudoxanthomonas suwonensis]
MNKRFVICGLVVSLASLLLDLLIHGLLLGDAYRQLATTGFVRGPDQAGQFLHWALLAHLLLGFGLTWMFSMADPARSRDLAFGLRFGTAAALLSIVPNAMILFALQPWPAALVHRQILLGTVMMLLLGLLLAWLQPARRAL